MKVQKQKNKLSGLFRGVCAIFLALSFTIPALAIQKKISLSFQDSSLREIMQMLSQQQRVNILISDGIDGNVSVNLYDVTVDQAIHTIANIAGFAVEHRKNNYYVIEHANVGKYGVTRLTNLKTFKIQYSDPSDIENILSKYLSSYGKITKLEQRRILVIEDTPQVLAQMESLLEELDKEPKQIFIEAKILEITLQDNESFGVDWKRLFSSGNDLGSFGTQGLSTPLAPGLFFSFIGKKAEIALSALQTRGRLRTLSSPKLLALENHEAQTIIGKNIGYQITVTTNDVTTTSTEFLESGIILKVTPSVDRQGRILLDIHPEVSDGTVNDNGVPSKTTTQVHTKMLVPDGQTVFIGGLIKHQVDETREGVPFLGDLPIIGSLFSNKSKNILNTETIVLITPKIVSFDFENWQPEEIEHTNRLDLILDNEISFSEKRAREILDGSSNNIEQQNVTNAKTSDVQVFDEYF